MKTQGQKMKRSGILIGTVVMVVLFGGGMAWASLNSGDIQLKQNKPKKQTQAQQQTQPQVSTQPATMDPFRDMMRLQQQIDQLFGNTMNPYSGFPDLNTAWNPQQVQPAMNLTEKPDAYVVSMAIPGVNKSDINVQVKNQVLTVSAEQKTSTKKENKNDKILVQERTASAFSRQVVLPKSVNADQVTADYKNGILTITLPKTNKSPAAHQIKIK